MRALPALAALLIGGGVAHAEDGACGYDQGQVVGSAPIYQTEWCKSGVPSFTTGGQFGPWTWDCVPIGSGASAHCWADTIGHCNDYTTGQSAAQAPAATAMCWHGLASAVSGTGPWSWACSGGATGTKAYCTEAVTAPTVAGSSPPVVSGVVTAPAVVQRSASGDIVGVKLVNETAAAIPSAYVTFGQAFHEGAVQPSDNLVTRGSGVSQAQMDALSLWPDGSVKLASIVLRAPDLAAGASAQMMLAKEPAGSSFSHLPIPFQLPSQIAATISFAGPAAQSVTFRIDDALAASANADTWLVGPLAVQARVDIPIVRDMHVTADVTHFADGTTRCDIGFNNDLVTMLPEGTPPGPVAPPLSYTVTVTGCGPVPLMGTVAHQYQYQDWRLSTPDSPLTIVHDVGYLRGWAVLPYDLGTGVSAQALADMATLAAGTDTADSTIHFGDPLADNGVTRAMPQVGDRGDIGPLTHWGSAWLISQDRRAARVALAQGDTAGAVDWNYRLANGHWLTPGDVPNAWMDPRSGASGAQAPANLPPGPTSSAVCDNSCWRPDTAHQPELSYLPYLMTARRWYLDRLEAQAAFNLVQWPPIRQVDGYGDIVVNTVHAETRAAAWALRQIMLAAWIGRPGTFENGYFSQAIIDNLSWAQQHLLRGVEAGIFRGMAVDYNPFNAYPVCPAPGCSPGSATNFPAFTATAPWQQDFVSLVFGWGAELGYSAAANLLAAQDGWITGRFAGLGHDACVYQIPFLRSPAAAADYQSQMTGAAPLTFLATWPDVEVAMVSSGLSYGSGWQSGYYCPIAKALLSVLARGAPTDAAALSALSLLSGATLREVSPAGEADQPKWSIVNR